MNNPIEEYLAKIREATVQPGVYAFRGQGNSKWPLHSGATRRLINEHGKEIVHDPDFHQSYIEYHRIELLEPARMKGFGVEDGHIISDLQILAKMQHFGAATGLMDFTRDPLVALWFACHNDAYDGKLFIVNTTETLNVASVSSDEDEQTAESVFRPVGSMPPLSYWEPSLGGDAMLRILRQRSVFIIGRPLIPADPNIVAEVEIPKAVKPVLLEELERLDKSHISLFQDVQGFSESQKVAFPLQHYQTPQRFLVRGNQAMHSGNFAEAIRCYSECIRLVVPKVSELYFLRGNAKSALDDFRGAIEDYDEAIAYRKIPFLGAALADVSSVRHPYLHLIYFNRGNAKVELSEIEDALKDYSEGIQLAPRLMMEGHFNHGNLHMDLSEFLDAVDDFNKAIDFGHKSAIYNKGNAFVMLGRFDEARRCYELLEHEGTLKDSAIQNLEALRSVIHTIGSRKYEVKYKTGEESHYGDLSQVAVYVDGDVPTQLNGFPWTWNKLFKGRVGNTGGFGWKGLPPGKGLAGKLGFILTIEQGM